MSDVKNSLQLLSAYDTTDESEEEVPLGKAGTECLHEENTFQSHTKLPLPKYINEKVTNVEIEEQNGRIRSFPHERGNWATYIFIPYESNPNMTLLVNRMIDSYSNFNLRPVDDFHVSLSKTVVLKHHWIDIFISSIKEQITTCNFKKFVVFLDSIEIYCNEEETRTFLGFKVQDYYNNLKMAVQIFDKCLAEFNLAQYYQNPSFHMSILWTPGNQLKNLQSKLSELQICVQTFIEEYPDGPWCVNANNFLCKTGNKLFAFHLS